MKIHSIYDNQGATFDRYTVYFSGRGTVRQTGIFSKPLRLCLGMSSNPTHPQGFGQWCEGQPGKHNGHKITFDQLPDECRALVALNLAGAQS